MGLILQLGLLLIFTSQSALAFVYSCEQVKYKAQLINENLDTDYICVVTQSNQGYKFTNFDQLNNIFVQNSDTLFNLTAISRMPNFCIKRQGRESWKLMDISFALDCDQEFTLIATSTNNPIVNRDDSFTPEEDVDFVCPRGGFVLSTKNCIGYGSISFSSGIGIGHEEDRFPLKTWRCAAIPQDMFLYGIVISIRRDNCSCAFRIFVSTTLNLGGDFTKVSILSSGRSNDMQNMQRWKSFTRFTKNDIISITMEYDLTFDPRYSGHITLTVGENDEQLYGNGSGTATFAASSIEAKSTCTNGGGFLATIHDDQKGLFLQQLMTSVSTKDNFWFGYEKTEDGKWIWEDGSADPYTNWDVDDPSLNSVAKCGYTINNKPNMPWGAGNCNAAYPYVCQYPPCSVGNKDC